MMTSAFDLKQQHTDIDSKLIAGLERLSQALRVLLWDEAKKEGLSPIQVQILIHLNHNIGVEQRVSALANRLDLTKATISDAVKTLEIKGLLKRVGDPHDARAFQLKLTAEGKAVATNVGQWAERIREFLVPLDSKSKQNTLFFVTELIESLQSAGIITVARMCRTCKFLSVSSIPGQSYYCNFLEKTLEIEDLRLDCPEHQIAHGVT